MTKINFLGLKAATRYEATVAAQNDEDWSRHSPVYHFSTFGAGISFNFLNFFFDLQNKMSCNNEINLSNHMHIHVYSLSNTLH